MVKYMKNKLVKDLENLYTLNPDFIIRELEIGTSKIYIVFLESVASGTKVDGFILRNLSRIEEKQFNEKNILNYISAPNLVEIKDPEEMDYYLANGFTLVIVNEMIYALETKADLFRSISEPTSEKYLDGPKDSFNENIQINMGLIKRRIKSSDLKTEQMIIGGVSKTIVNILYMENITDINIVKIIKNQLEKINIDAIYDSGNIADFLAGEKKTALPTIASTERPDRVASSLLEGKVIVLVDNSPQALILPTFFVDFINPIGDNYIKNNNINFVKILRFFCFFLTVMIPGLYIALISYNPEILPTSLLINFVNQNQNVPFPIFVEALIMILICEILRESDLRFPSNYGSAISILGALILGEAAVNSGIVSPVMIIVVAFTYITSLIFTEIVMINAIRHFRWLFLISGFFLGFYGIVLTFIYFLIHATNLDSVGYPYFYSIAPFDSTYLKKTLMKKPINRDRRRSNILVKKNVTKQRSKI